MVYGAECISCTIDLNRLNIIFSGAWYALYYT